jgi:hypothetical protein
MSARVTFSNVNGLTNPVPHVSLESREVTADQEEILTTPFTTPISTSRAYRRHGSGSDVGTSVDPPTPTDTAPPTSTKTIETCRINDEIFAYPAGYSRNSQYGGNVADQEEELIQLAIRQSLLDQGERLESLDKEMTLVEALKDQEIRDQTQRDNHQRMGGNDDISLAMALSQVQATEDERLRQQEEEELERVLRLSMIDK